MGFVDRLEDILIRILSVILYILPLFALMLVIVSILADYGFHTGQGEQIGYISEIKESGIVWRPPEVKVISVNPTFSEHDTIKYYGVTKTMVKSAEKYANEHRKVIIYYKIHRFVWYWEYANRNVIYKIEPVKGD